MEILVHVSAPTSAGDDARYHAQIAAIMSSFQPISAAPGPGPATPDLTTIPGIATSIASPSNTQSAGIPAHPGSPAAADRRPQSPSSFSSSSSSPSPSHPPSSRPGQLLGSTTGPAPDLQRVCSPARLDAIGPEALAPAPLVHLQEAEPAACNPLPTSNCNSLESLVSVIPDSQPSEQPLFPSRPEDGPHTPAPHPPEAQAKASLVALKSDLPSPERTPKRRRLETETEAEAEAAPKITTTAHNASITSLLHSLPIKITPPPPPISTSPFITHITPTLSMLTQRLKPERIYKPLQQTRDLDKLERGYWSLRIPIQSTTPSTTPAITPSSHNSLQPPWDTSSFHRFWSFLSDFIGKDARAGWGVWCIVEREIDPIDSDTKETSHSLPSTASTDLDNLSPPLHRSHPGTPAIPDSLSLSLKMYAWGEVAMHIYLLLFLASERRVRGMGAEWRDSGEEVVIKMP